MDAFATKAGRSIFARNLKQYEPKDPLYELYIDDHGKQRRRKVRTVMWRVCMVLRLPVLQRETPPGLSKRDIKVLKSVQKRAHYLDKGFHICGMRFGWTFIIGAYAFLPWRDGMFLLLAYRRHYTWRWRCCRCRS